MTDEKPEPDPPLTPEQETKIAQLSEAEVATIDDALLGQASQRWRKVAMVVGITMGELPERVKGIPDVYYARRVRALVEKGRLESQGNLDYMRFSEVRLPSPPAELE